MGVKNKAACDAIIGKSGTGKSTIVKRMLQAMKPKRVIVWSPDEDEDEYAKLIGGKVYRDIDSLIIGLRQPDFKAVFWPSMDKTKRDSQFSHICMFCYTLKNLVFIVEELKSVTSPTYAPFNWSLLSTRGRKKGVHVVGITQRPTMIDKDFLGNTSSITCLALKYPNDRKAVADAMVLSASELEVLKPFEWVKVSDEHGKQTGKITF